MVTIQWRIRNPVKHQGLIGVSTRRSYNLVDTRRRFNVCKTSIRRRQRRIDVLQTLKRTSCVYWEMSKITAIPKEITIAIFYQYLPSNSRYYPKLVLAHF